MRLMERRLEAPEQESPEPARSNAVGGCLAVFLVAAVALLAVLALVLLRKEWVLDHSGVRVQAVVDSVRVKPRATDVYVHFTSAPGGRVEHAMIELGPQHAPATGSSVAVDYDARHPGTARLAGDHWNGSLGGGLLVLIGAFVGWLLWRRARQR